MFNGMFNDEHTHNCGCDGHTGGGCTWVLLIILFLTCCGGKLKNFTLNINPCCLILLGALLFCTGGVKVTGDCGCK